MILQQGRPKMILVGLVVIGGPYGYWGRICILIIGNGDSDSNIALKVFYYPFDVEVGDGLNRKMFAVRQNHRYARMNPIWKSRDVTPKS